MSSDFFLYEKVAHAETRTETALSRSCCTRGPRRSSPRACPWLQSCFFYPSSGKLEVFPKRLSPYDWKWARCFFLYWANSSWGWYHLVTFLVTVLRGPPTYGSTLWVLPSSGSYHCFREHLWKVWQGGTLLFSFSEWEELEYSRTTVAWHPEIKNQFIYCSP